MNMGWIIQEEGTLHILMDRILAWNVMGLNLTHKQGAMKKFIHKHQFGVVGLLEHKVKIAKLGNLYQKVFLNWCFTSNSSYHDGGVVLAWNPSIFVVNILNVTSKLIHCLVKPMSGLNSFYCTFIYAFNESHKRVELWRGLKALHTREAWIVCGDFNCVMSLKGENMSSCQEL